MLVVSTLARGLRAIGRIVRDFFRAILWPSPGDPLKELDEAFSPIDVEAGKKRFNLAEEAKRFGERGLPDSGDATLDGPQLGVIHFVQEEVANAFRRANRELERLRNALKGRDVETLVAEAERLPDEVIQIIERETREAKKHMESVALQRQELERDMQQYRARYRVDRLPRLRDATERRLLIYATLMLALLQAAANAVFFAQGMPLGLTAGIWFAIVLGIADVTLHSILGYHAARVHAPDWGNRILGAALIAFALFTVPFYNLGLVHLRLNVRRLGFVEGTDLWWNSLTTDLFGFTDFGSFALLIIGLGCSALAVVAGWSWDEPVPRLREAGRKLQNLRMEHDFWEERQLKVGYEARAEAEAALERTQGQVEHNVLMAQALVGRIERLQQNLNAFVKDAERACKALIQTYRDENRLARTAPPPSYFKGEPVLKFENPIDIDLSELKQFLDSQMKLRDRLAQRSHLLHERIATSGGRQPRTTVRAR